MQFVFQYGDRCLQTHTHTHTDFSGLTRPAPAPPTGFFILLDDLVREINSCTRQMSEARFDTKGTVAKLFCIYGISAVNGAVSDAGVGY